MSSFPDVWDLSSLANQPESDEFRESLSNLGENLKSLAESAAIVFGTNKSVTRLSDLLQLYQELRCQYTDTVAIVECYAAADSTNELYQNYEALLATYRPYLEQIQTLIDYFLTHLPVLEYEALEESDEFFRSIKFYLAESRATARFRLPKAEEKLASEMDIDGIHAWGRLYDRLAGKLKIPVLEKGDFVHKSPGQVLFDSPERSVRENNFFASNKAWHEIADPCAAALNHIAGSRLLRVKRLNLDDHLSYPLHLGRIQRETLGAMWSAVSERKQMMVDYLEVKKRLLGLDQLCWYDLQAPLSVGAIGESPQIDYGDACEKIIDAFRGFSQQFGEFSEMALREKWIEAENRSGKRAGGFCTTIHAQRQSRIFMTYTGTPDGVSTLAHELGHAYHSWVLRDEPFFHQQYPMTLAETASTFAEAVLGEVELKEANSAAEKLVILDKMLQDSTAFLMNIHARFLFEDRMHQLRLEQELTADQLSELMVAAQKEAFGGALDDAGWNPMFWASKLHFYISTYPFYNFPYTFGYLLSLGIFQMGRSEPNFPLKYDKFLVSTGHKTSEQAVESSFGHDLTGPAFWNQCLDVVQERVTQFSELAKSL